ncbi:MAG: hypothetical protein ABIH37_00365 [archaeon]
MAFKIITYADVLECVREHTRVKGMWESCSGEAWDDGNYIIAVESKHNIGPNSNNPLDILNYQRVEQFYAELQRFKRLDRAIQETGLNLEAEEDLDYPVPGDVADACKRYNSFRPLEDRLDYASFSKPKDL